MPAALCAACDTHTRQIHEVQKKAFQETSAMKDGKRRLKQRCENDLKHVHDAIQKVCVCYLFLSVDVESG